MRLLRRLAHRFRRGAAVAGCAGALSLALVAVPAATPAAQGAATPVIPAPIAPLIPELGGAAAGTGAVEVGAAGAAGLSGSGAIAAVLVFGASYYGTTKALHWLFDDPPQPGAQPNLSGSGLYCSGNPPDGAPGSFQTFLPSGWKRLAGCTQSGFTRDANAAGTYANLYSTCFSNGALAPTSGNATVGVTLPAWRCIAGAGQCSGSVKIVALNSQGTVWQGPVGFGSFTSAAAPAGAQTQTQQWGFQCLNSTGWSSPAMCQSNYTAAGWDIWYDPTKVEFSPVSQSTLKTTRTCRNLTTGAVVTTTTTSQSFYGAESANVDLAPALGCPSGQTGQSATIDLCNGSGASCSQVQSWTADTHTVNPPPSDPYRDCLPGGSNAPCPLKLYKATASGWKLCDQYANCSGYHAATATSAKWRCEWGPHVVPVSQCEPLEKWASTTGANTGTDPDPDPETSPDPTPTASPSTGTIPDAGENPASVPATDPDADPDTSNCFSDGWSLNPISWVYIPVKCALKWAFLPRTNMSDRMTAWKGAFDGRVPFAWWGDMTPPGVVGSGNCPSWRIHVLSENEEILCGHEWEGYLRGARPWLAAGMIGIALAPFLRSLGYASIPALKMSRGSD